MLGTFTYGTLFRIQRPSNQSTLHKNLRIGYLRRLPNIHSYVQSKAVDSTRMCKNYDRKPIIHGIWVNFRPWSVQ